MELFILNLQNTRSTHTTTEDKDIHHVSRTLALHALESFSGIKMEDIIIKRDVYGKPHVVSVEKLHYNISHSNHYMICAVDHIPVGIDIEFVNPTRALGPFDWIMSDMEKEIFDSMHRNERRKYCHMTWCAKECYQKLIGIGINASLKDIYVDREQSMIRRVSEGMITLGYYQQLDIDDCYVASICSEHPIKHINKKAVTINELILQTN